MPPMHRTTLFWSWCLVLLSALLASAQQPESAITYFPNHPARLFFFDDSSTTIFHDVVEGNVYVSDDEGKSWNRATDIPTGHASMVIEHPFDNHYAFVLTQGNQHYRTSDRGKSWQNFAVSAPPAYVGRPLSFHSDPKKYGYILYQGTVCGSGWGARCHDETYYTKDAFGSDAQLLLTETSRCQFAHSSKDFKHEAPPDLIYCVGFDTSSTSGNHALTSSRLFSSSDFFQSENKVEDLGIGKNARGVVAFAIVSKFAVVALKDLNGASDGDMLLYVSVNTKDWAKAQFPHASSAQLRENSYTVVESTTHSLAVDVVLQDMSTIGTLFVSNSNGTYFVESLKDTNRNEMGFVDYENLYGVEGVGLANIVGNSQEAQNRLVPKQLQTRITFNDGRSWSSVKAPSLDADGKRVSCNTADIDQCSLHLHSVTVPHNFGRIFSSPAPGVVMAVGSIGPYLQNYEDSDTFLSLDAGVTWEMVRRDAHKYEFGDSGSILVAINDEEATDTVSYSTDFGKSWKTYNFGIKFSARILTTVSDSTSQKFILIGQLARKDQPDAESRYASVFLDFAPIRTRKCEENDFETWYARTAKESQCLMGHKQWYRRRKQDANCYVGNKFDDPVEHEDNCECTKEDYECDYNYALNGDKCVAVGPEPVPINVCDHIDQTYQGSSGYRRIPGNTCVGGEKLDNPVTKQCSQAQPAEGEVTHQLHQFDSAIIQHQYFEDSHTLLVRLADHTLWQSVNEGYSWNQINTSPDDTFLVFYIHKYAKDRAYAITNSKKFLYTTNTGKHWLEGTAPTPPNSFGQMVLHFHPNSDRLIWTGDRDCEGSGATCNAEAQYSRDNGRNWNKIDNYIRNCAWAEDAALFVDPTEIICESYRDKQGSQKKLQQDNPLELVEGQNYYQKKKKLFDNVVGFAKFSEYLIVAEYQERKGSLDLQVSLDGLHFATGLFPPTTRPDQHAYTILESSTSSVFIHVTMSEAPYPYWGSILKSNSNGTYYGSSIDFVNRDERGYVDFEKMIGLDGIALINIVSNPTDASVNAQKELQSRITHNDGGTWKPLVPPRTDSQGRKYDCDSTRCALHVHGYTERYDARATFSSPSIPGIMMAVGNVGESLAPYTDSDTFLSRDGGFTWEEVYKDAHLWEFGDSGSVLIMVNDEEPTDHVLFSTDEGISWREYKFTNEKMRVRSIVTVPMDTSRRFILMGTYPRLTNSVAIQINFESLTRQQCVLDLEDPGKDDFELWSPSEEREERCLFGRQTLYHRRVRDKQCIVGTQEKAKARIIKHCPCMETDFECEFNHERDESGACVLIQGLQALPNDDSCLDDDQEYWYERTPYRRIPFSSCEGGTRLDRGNPHICPGIRAHGALFWWTIILIPFAFTSLVVYWYYRRSGLARGMIRLPGESAPLGRIGAGSSDVMSTLASVPWFLIGLVGIAYESIASMVESATLNYRSRRGYRDVPVDEDAQVLRFEDEEY